MEAAAQQKETNQTDEQPTNWRQGSPDQPVIEKKNKLQKEKGDTDHTRGVYKVEHNSVEDNFNY